MFFLELKKRVRLSSHLEHVPENFFNGPAGSDVVNPGDAAAIQCGTGHSDALLISWRTMSGYPEGGSRVHSWGHCERMFEASGAIPEIFKLLPSTTSSGPDSPLSSCALKTKEGSENLIRASWSLLRWYHPPAMTINLTVADDGLRQR